MSWLVVFVSPHPKNIYMLFPGREVRIGKNCAVGLEYGPRPAASGRTQDRGHSFSLYGPPGREITYIYYLPAGRSVLRKTVPEVLSTARGRRPRAVLKTEGTVFLNTDRPRPANIFIFFLLFFKS